jgi:chemotaxis protein MotB
MNKDREAPLRIIVRKKRHEHGGHGGAWKVAFADFMTAMFALFLVLWLVNQSSEVRSSIAGYFANPLGFPGEAGSSLMPSDGAVASAIRPVLIETFSLRRLQLRELESRLQKRMEGQPELQSVAANIEMEIVDEGLRIQLLEDSSGVFFETGSSDPKPEGRQVLQILGTELAPLPNIVIIEGHTDARQYAAGNSYTNWELSADRANAARRILTSRGMRDTQIGQIRGLADRQLRDPEDPMSPSNRRVTITIQEMGKGQFADSSVAANQASRGAS